MGWLVASAGGSLVRRLRGDPARAALRMVVEDAVEEAVAEVATRLDAHQAAHVRSSLLVRDIDPCLDQADVTSAAQLRRALHRWTAALDHPVFGGRGYLRSRGVSADRLADALCVRIAAGIVRNGRAGGALRPLAEWMWRDSVTDHLVRIEARLDTALDVDQVCPLLPHAAGCLVLITSRSRLRGLPGARALPLDVLPPAEAIALFTHLVDVGRPLDPDAVASVVGMVGCLPLAVQAVAGQVEESYTEAELADDLAEASTGPGLVDRAGALGTTVRTAFVTSLRRLDPPRRHAFRLLGVHPGPSVGVPQFAALADLPIASARATLRGLADRNLIMASRGRVGHHRYQLHDLMREFVRGQAASYLSKQERAAAVGRLATWYATAMTAVAHLLARPRSTTGRRPEKPDVVGLDLDRLETASRWLAAEQSNLLAFADAADATAADVCWQAARNLFYLDRYATARALYQAAVGLCQQAGNRVGEATARWGLGEVSRLTGDYPAAVMHYRAAHTTFAEIGNHIGQAQARLGLGDVARLTDRYPAAAAHFRAAATVFAESAFPGGQAEARLGLGDVARLTCDHAAAVTHFQVARTSFAEIGNRPGQAEARWGLGDVARLTGDYPTAAGHFHAAWTTFVGIGDRAGEADARRAMGDVAKAAGDYPAAAEHYRAAHTIYAELGHRAGRVGTRQALDDLACATGDRTATAEPCRTADAIDAEGGDHAPRVTAATVRGEAAKLWKRAHRIYDDSYSIRTPKLTRSIISITY